MLQRFRRLSCLGLSALFAFLLVGCATAEQSTSLPRARPIADGQFWVIDGISPGQTILPQPPLPPIVADQGKYDCIIDGGLPPVGSGVKAQIPLDVDCKGVCPAKRDTTKEGFTYHCKLATVSETA